VIADRLKLPPGRVGCATMGATVATAGCHAHGGYRHEAFFYAGHDQFMHGTLSFVHEALRAEEPILVVLGAAKIETLRQTLEDDAREVVFADMAELGTNPARIIPAWEQFVERHAAPGRRLWGIGEPIWAGRSAPELAECQRHEALLNVVFSDPAFTLMCPYDTVALDAAVLEEARRNHPFVRDGGAAVESERFPGAAALAAPFDEPLPNPPRETALLHFGPGALGDVRSLVSARANAAQLPAERVADLVLAVNEVATNSLLHGGGNGALRIWLEPGAIVCEVRDAGRLDDPLAGRRRPRADAVDGRGLWLANQLCELVQVRVFPDSSVIRMHMRLSAS
jgi:anti-sigma regulatory factor (Ser/Thr protein kinase)